ncbi:MAG: hypothetical protein G01um101433_822 [Parcubacteria group bacterium Gr01-1014_33]|nr:MAG: hypothetical protein G01um101433_822 [Parcubacteria group bacterium Gr01-1014_33]
MYRTFEVLPAALAWGTLIAITVFSWQAPVEAALFIILFDVYWLMKTVYLSLHLRSSFKKMRENMKINWLERLGNLRVSQIADRESSKDSSNGPRLAIGDWQEIYHLVILPVYKEPYDVVRESILSLARTNYLKEKLLVVLATEERAPESQEVAEKIRQEFGSQFFKFLITVHPDNIPGELAGKGSNETWAGRGAKEKLIDPLHIPYERVLVSVFDSDTQVFPEYFGILTYQFLIAPHPHHSSYQPIPLFTNNIFSAPALGRVISFSSSFWHMIQQARPERLTTFSSQSIPFKALVEIGFWNTNAVSEDSQIFWQCFLHYNGDWRTVPILYPVSMDANVAPTLWKTLKNIYKQQRRWGWGCENIPYFLTGFLRNKDILLRKKLYWSFHYIEGFHSWATNALILFSMGWLPIFLGGAEFRVSILSYNLPRIVGYVMNASAIGIVSSAVLGMILLPPKPAWFRRRHYFLYAIQWLFMPLTLILFGAIPALDAQTRLALGGKWRLGFWSTPKYRE